MRKRNYSGASRSKPTRVNTYIISTNDRCNIAITHCRAKNCNTFFFIFMQTSFLKAISNHLFFSLSLSLSHRLLHMAIVQGFLEAAFSLIRMAPHACLLNILNDDCQSPLHLAVLTRQPRIVRRLILAGANPTLRNFSGNTALHLACATGDLASAKALTDPLTLVERNYLRQAKEIPALPQNLEQRNYDGN